MVKKALCLSLLSACILLPAAQAPAAIPQSYLDEICGTWYFPCRGYTFMVEPYDDNYVVMTVNDDDISRDHTGSLDSEEYDRRYYLYFDGSKDQVWECEDGRISLELYESVTNNEWCEAYVIWMHTNTDEERAFYDDLDMFSLCKPDLTKCEKYDYDSDDLHGEWISQTDGSSLFLQARPYSVDIYGQMDYLVTRTQDGNLLSERVMTYTDKKLQHMALPFERSHYELKSFHTLEFYDENDHLVETFEKSGYTAPLHD